jgi:hypothetical protein
MVLERKAPRGAPGLAASAVMCARVFAAAEVCWVEERVPLKKRASGSPILRVPVLMHSYGQKEEFAVKKPRHSSGLVRCSRLRGSDDWGRHSIQAGIAPAGARLWHVAETARSTTRPEVGRSCARHTELHPAQSYKHLTL